MRLFLDVNHSLKLVSTGNQLITMSDLPAAVTVAPRSAFPSLISTLPRQQSSEDRPVCGSTKARQGYNTSLHVFALFLILVLSTAGM